jgi:hypothetical protein
MYLFDGLSHSGPPKPSSQMQRPPLNIPLPEQRTEKNAFKFQNVKFLSTWTGGFLAEEPLKQKLLSAFFEEEIN